MGLTPQEEIVLSIVKAARKDSPSRPSSALTPPEGNVPPTPRNSISPISPASSSYAAPAFGSFTPRDVIEPVPVITANDLYPLPLSTTPRAKLGHISTSMASNSRAKGVNLSLPEFRVTSTATPTPSPISPPPLATASAAKRGKTLLPIRPRLPTVDSNEIRGYGSPGLAGSLAAQFEEVEASFGLGSFTGQFEEVERMCQSAPPPATGPSSTEQNEPKEEGSEAITPKLSAPISHDASIAPLNISSSPDNLTTNSHLSPIRTPSPKSHTRLEAEINAMLGLPATSKPSYQFMPPSPLIVMMATTSTDSAPPPLPPKGGGFGAIKRKLEEAAKQSSSSSSMPLNDSERQDAVRDIRTKATKSSFFEPPIPDHLLTKRDPNALMPNVLNTSIRQMIDTDGRELSDAEREHARETELERIQKEILEARKKQGEDDETQAKKVIEEANYGEGLGTSSGSEPGDKVDGKGEGANAKKNSEEAKDGEETKEIEQAKDVKEAKDSEGAGAGSGSGSRGGHDGGEGETKDSGGVEGGEETKDGEDSGSGNKGEEKEDKGEKMPDLKQGEAQKSSDGNGGRSNNGSSGSENGGSGGGDGRKKGTGKGERKVKSKSKRKSPFFDDESDDESDEEGPPPSKGRRIKIEKVKIPEAITIYQERCLNDATKGGTCVDLGRSAMVAYEQMVHEHSVKILNQENIIQALKRVEVTGLAALKSQKNWADDLQRQLEAARRSGGGVRGGGDCEDLRERLKEKDEEIQRLKAASRTGGNEELARSQARIAELEATPSDMIHKTEHVKYIEKAKADTKTRLRSVFQKQLDDFKEDHVSRDDCDKEKEGLEFQIQRLKDRYGEGTGKKSYDELEKVLEDVRKSKQWLQKSYDMKTEQFEEQDAKFNKAKEHIKELREYIAVWQGQGRKRTFEKRKKDPAADAKEEINSLKTESKKWKTYFISAKERIAQLESQLVPDTDPETGLAAADKDALTKAEETIEALKARLKNPSAKDSDCEAALKEAIELLNATQKELDAKDDLISDLVHGKSTNNKPPSTPKKGQHYKCGNARCDKEKTAYLATIDRLSMELKATGERLEAQLRTLVRDQNYGQGMRIDDLITALAAETTDLSARVQEHLRNLDTLGIQSPAEKHTELRKKLTAAEADLRLTTENCATAKKDLEKKNQECREKNADLQAELSNARKATGGKSPGKGADDDMVRQAEDAQLAKDVEEKAKQTFAEEKDRLQRKIDRRDNTIATWKAANRTFEIALDAMKRKHGELSQEEVDKLGEELVPDDPSDETAPVLFALTRVEIALVEMVHARARLGAQEGDADVALSAAQDAVAKASALDNELYTSRDYIARANIWLTVALLYAGNEVDVESAMREAHTFSQHLNDDDLRIHFDEWMDENRISSPVNKTAPGYRKGLSVNPTWKRKRRSSGKGGGSDDPKSMKEKSPRKHSAGSDSKSKAKSKK